MDRGEVYRSSSSTITVILSIEFFQSEPEVHISHTNFFSKNHLSNNSIKVSKKSILLYTSRSSHPSSLNCCSKDVDLISIFFVGVSITTPSNGMQFNFDSLMVGGTGLTPVSGPLPTCSIQQRNLPISIADVTSPDSCNPPKLVSL